MTDERADKLRVIQDRGRRYSIALSVMHDFIESMESQVVESFRHSDVHDHKGHQAQRFYFKVLDDFKERAEYFIRTGEDARKELVRMKRPSLVQKVRNAS